MPASLTVRVSPSGSVSLARTLAPLSAVSSSVAKTSSLAPVPSLPPVGASFRPLTVKVTLAVSVATPSLTVYSRVPVAASPTPRASKSPDGSKLTLPSSAMLTLTVAVKSSGPVKVTWRMPASLTVRVSPSGSVSLASTLAPLSAVSSSVAKASPAASGPSLPAVGASLPAVGASLTPLTDRGSAAPPVSSCSLASSRPRAVSNTNDSGSRVSRTRAS